MMFASTSPMFAAVGDSLPKPGMDSSMSQALNGAVPVIVGALVVLFGLIFWATFVRKSDRRRQRGEILEGPPRERSHSSEGGRRRRRRREKGRVRNPTLAETGGLPPVRDPSTPPPTT